MTFNDIEYNFTENFQSVQNLKCVTKWTGKSDLTFTFFLPSAKY